MSSAESRIYDVLVLGAGPTGLTTAALSRRCGLSVHVVDRAPGPLPLGRADALNARTQQLFETIGVMDGLEPIGLRCDTSSTFKDGAFIARRSHWWRNLQNTNYKSFLMIGQPMVEREILKNMDIDPSYDTEVTGIEEFDELVTVHTTKGELKAKYVVGADGAKSLVRSALQIVFEGTKPEMTWVVMDVFLDTDFNLVPEIINFEIGEQSRVSYIPRERGMARFYVLLEGGEITLERAQESVRNHLAPHRVDFKEVEWWSTFYVQERVAQTYLSPKRRIVLAGDAAHVHSVNGGQGLNTGVNDAFALVWRLNLLIKGGSGRLIDSYDLERGDIARGVVGTAARLVRSTLKTAEEYVGIIEKSAAYITGMGIVYPDASPLLGGAPSGGWVPGTRAPDFLLTNSASGETKRLYQFAQCWRFILFYPASRESHVAAYDLIERVPFTVAKGSTEVELGGEKWVTSFELPEGKEVAIRPDLYVGYVGIDAKGYFANFLPGST